MAFGSPKPEFEPGAVYEIDARLLCYPTTPGPQPFRKNRWIVVASNKYDCKHLPPHSLLIVALSAALEHFDPRWDVEIPQGVGGTLRDCMAQADMVFPVAKSDLRASRRRGTIPADTMNQLRAKLRDALGLAGPFYP